MHLPVYAFLRNTQYNLCYIVICSSGLAVVHASVTALVTAISNHPDVREIVTKTINSFIIYVAVGNLFERR